jgi:UDP-N-acetyl-D-glucosamine dehydrogenase
VDDDRESPTYVLWKKLLKLGASVAYYDPCCPVVRPTREHPELAGVRSRTWEEIPLDRYDVAIVATAHDQVDHATLAQAVPLIVDTRGSLPAGGNVVRA